jgi:hypothetical protein
MRSTLYLVVKVEVDCGSSEIDPEHIVNQCEYSFVSTVDEGRIASTEIIHLSPDCPV